MRTLHSFRLVLLLLSFCWSCRLIQSATARDTCDVSSTNRVDCHPEPGADATKCHSRGCCWRPPADNSHNVAWCFHPSSPQTTGSCGVQDEHRTDCHPNAGATPSECRSRGCCWHRSSTKGVPWCFMSTNHGYSAQVSGNSASLHLKSSTHWQDINPLRVNLQALSGNTLNFKIFDPNHNRYEVPISLNKPSGSAGSDDYTYRLKQDPFGVIVTRKSTGSVLFDSTVTGLTFSDQYIQLTTSVPTSYIYGLGEYRDRFWLDPSKNIVRALWARDDAPHVKANLYGSHPFFLAMETDGNAFGVYLHNSNAMEINLVPSYPVTIRYKVTGGVLDFYIFTGPTPSDVIDQYWSLIGKPPLPPYWSLGYHLSRWGYGTGDGLKRIINRMRNLNMPHDVQWGDIDYMRDHLDWTYDRTKFGDLPAIVKDLHDHGQRFVCIVDPGISSTQGSGRYDSYDRGIRDDVFIKNADGSVLIGEVWPGLTAYPDFTAPNTEAWWERDARSFHQQVPFDGLWIDMNEPSNFKDGSIHGCTSSSLDNPPYLPAVTGHSLHQKTICPSSRQHLGVHYNLHNLYGHFEGKATYSALHKITGKRPFILSRSTFAGSGQYVAHWEGDNYASWEDMAYSIPEILNFNMFGIPFVGVDICGFRGRTTEELCTRWLQLGAFYPFMRSHRDKDGPDQDPAAGMFSTAAHDRNRKSLQLRYKMLPMLYTLFSKSKPVIRPLFFQYPRDSNTYPIDDQFMWGSELLISPVLRQGERLVNAYFPADTWYDFYSGHRITSSGHRMSLSAPLDTINVHVRGGSIIPTQEPDLTTKKSRTKDFGLLVALSSRHEAEGSLFWDDGETLNGPSNKFKFHAAGNKLTITRQSSQYTTTMNLGSVSVYGVTSSPAHVSANGVGVPHTYDSARQALHITNLHIDLLNSATSTITWS
ncbi:lysosomal alpha-glucosidase-like [Gigantopelta aegis]|uniref:lysosomal alpha-glucosidase-like n=1 Tax=Gigantopelta aegis TaxID=1735272 RepID=UPI001B8873B8|nr:lysosomal alpha-glucosidase-like [Gigantopelta aegis]